MSPYEITYPGGSVEFWNEESGETWLTRMLNVYENAIWSTSELIDWLKLLMTDDVDAKILREKDPKKLIPPLHGALLKNEQDVHLFERLAFISRRENENVE